MNLSEIFIRRPIATTLLMAAILMFGMVSYELLPVAAHTLYIPSAALLFRLYSPGI